MSKLSKVSSSSVFVLLLTISAFAQNVTIRNLHLESTTLQVANPFANISASCNHAACIAFAPVVPPTSVVCPGPVGTQCFLKVHVNIYNFFATSNSIAGIRFLGDNTETTVQPNSSFLAVWQGTRGLPITATLTEASATFVIKATNYAHNQKHSVEVDVGCRDEITGANGCLTGTFFSIFNAGDPPGPPAIVETAVYTSRGAEK